ncbi:2-hydroxyacid dehydrogenase [Caballeronia sp. Lep1P3]|uniref:2-hydroxyacid dehydrogenase n=1 Tax=Caballeronia sp. Lep1P3 TaxID=2878150 RepID=UPI001FD438DD|nr:2-hydroxyacid dehydrogenase [Caballeronia sp. Lep1P3]
MVKPVILNAAELPGWAHEELHALFTVLDLPKDCADARAFLAQHGPKVRGIALRKTPIDAAFLDALPALEIISSYSAGLDNLDVNAAKARGVSIANTSHILSDDVANAAVGLALAVTRDFVNADAFVRAGRWPQEKEYPLARSLTRMKVGIVGLGTIGSAIALRLAAFGCELAYFGPSRKPVAMPYFDDVAQLARACDMLILTCPLTPATHHLVDAKVIDALGRDGFIVNIARGPVLDERALVEALAADRIAGAALDVFEHEPRVPDALMRDRRVVLTPHLGSGTKETRRRMAEHVVDALARHFDVAGPRDAVHRVAGRGCAVES